MATTNLGKVSVTPKGEYDPFITYERLDVISHNGSSYIVKQTSTGVTPIEGEFYALIAEKGDSGSFVKKAYKTYAAMDADKVNIPANSSVDVTNDPDESKNGAYIYDGVNFIKSPYNIEDSLRAKVQNVFATYKLMQESDLKDGSYALIANSGELWKKEGGVWLNQRGKASPVAQNTEMAISFEDARDQTFAYFDVNGNMHFKQKVYSDEQELATKQSVEFLSAKSNLGAVAMAGNPIKIFADIDSYSDGGLTKRMPSGIKLKDGQILCFYHRQVQGYDGDFTGSQLWKAYITVDDNLAVTVSNRELFIKPDTTGGVIKHPMLGRTSDSRIVLVFERREDDAEPYQQFVCFSSNEGQTFTEPVLIQPSGIRPSADIALGTTGSILTVENNRLIFAMYTSGGVPFTVYSDNDGATWTFSDFLRLPPGDTWSEPSITVDANRNIVMDLRPMQDQGFRGRAISYNNGLTWVYLGKTDLASPQSQGNIFYDDSIGLTLQTRNNTTTSRTKFTLTLSLDNDKTHPFNYQPFSDSWYGGYSQIIKLNEGLYAVLVEYETVYVQVNHQESAGVLIVNLKEVLNNVKYN